MANKTNKTARAKPTQPKEKAAKRTKPTTAAEDLDDDEEVGMVVCKDFVLSRWEISQTGRIMIWQPKEDDEERATKTMLDGPIIDVEFDKRCKFVVESEGSGKNKGVTVNICDNLMKRQKSTINNSSQHIWKNYLLLIFS